MCQIIYYQTSTATVINKLLCVQLWMLHVTLPTFAFHKAHAIELMLQITSLHDLSLHSGLTPSSQSLTSDSKCQ